MRLPNGDVAEHAYDDHDGCRLPEDMHKVLHALEDNYPYLLNAPVAAN